MDALSRDASDETDHCRVVQLTSGSTGTGGTGDRRTGPDRVSVSVRRAPAAVTGRDDPGLARRIMAAGRAPAPAVAPAVLTTLRPVLLGRGVCGSHS